MPSVVILRLRSKQEHHYVGMFGAEFPIREACGTEARWAKLGNERPMRN